MIPQELVQDRNWRGTLYIFTHHTKLQGFIPTHIDFQEGTIEADALKRISKSKCWSPSEKFMLSLALHLYSERHNVNLSDMDRLDSYNTQIALKAIQMRFAG